MSGFSLQLWRSFKLSILTLIFSSFLIALGRLLSTFFFNFFFNVETTVEIAFLASFYDIIEVKLCFCVCCLQNRFVCSIICFWWILPCIYTYCNENFILLFFRWGIGTFNGNLKLWNSVKLLQLLLALLVSMISMKYPFNWRKNEFTLFC